MSTLTEGESTSTIAIHPLIETSSKPEDNNANLIDIVEDLVPELDSSASELKRYLLEHGSTDLSTSQQAVYENLCETSNFHLLSSTANSSLQACQRLLQMYQDISTGQDNQTKRKLLALKESWGVDKHEVEDLLQIGRDLTAKRLTRMVPKGVTSEPEATTAGQGSSQVPKGAEVFEARPSVDQTLQRTFFGLLRGVYHMTKEIPKI